MQNLRGCINSVDRLSWNGLIALVRHAKSVFSIDTSICHVAAAAHTPLIAVYTGITGVGRWRPEGQAVTIWTNHVPCSPCGRQNGCKDMTCLKGISPADLLGSLQECAVPTVRLTSLASSKKRAEAAQGEGEAERIAP
jgi:ADP-heptose:LPS heptosyltransferase